MHDKPRIEANAAYTWVTTTELAKRHKVTTKTIRLMARTGRIPAIRYGTVWRYPLELVERTLLEQASATTP